jgi:hypothetical protein
MLILILILKLILILILILKIWDEMDEATKDIREDAKQRHAKRILDEVQSMMSKMGIE